VCSIPCARKLVADRKKAEKADTKRRKEAAETPRELLPKVQAVFNKFIRLRDKDKPCICCGEPLGDQRFGGAYDAGHWRSVGAAKHLRFNEDNVHAQRKKCNDWEAGRAAEYRIGLVARIGIERVVALENNNEVHKWTVDELRALRTKYRNMVKELEKA
jgi:hypothetical protein